MLSCFCYSYDGTPHSVYQAKWCEIGGCSESEQFTNRLEFSQILTALVLDGRRKQCYTHITGSSSFRAFSCVIERSTFLVLISTGCGTHLSETEV
jgi:hypothetical protein